jgi:hypothetical protein
VLKLTHRFRDRMTAAGFTLRGARDHPIAPVMLGDARLAAEFADEMLKRGVYVVGCALGEDSMRGGGYDEQREGGAREGFDFASFWLSCYRRRATCPPPSPPLLLLDCAPLTLSRNTPPVHPSHLPRTPTPSPSPPPAPGSFSFPVVPKGLARIRTQISAAHTEADVDWAVDAFIEVGRAKGIIN